MRETPQPERRVDATRRTHLANERIYLAWLRSGMGDRGRLDDRAVVALGGATILLSAVTIALVILDA
jgi:hypothetical protein